MQSLIFNDCLKVSIDGHYEPHVGPKLLLQLSIWEPNNIMVCHSEEGGLKEARDADKNIITSDDTLCTILPPQPNNMYSQYKLMCGCECYISVKSIHS